VRGSTLPHAPPRVWVLTTADWRAPADAASALRRHRHTPQRQRDSAPGSARGRRG